MEHIEDHPGFQTLVDHETRGVGTFNRWTASGYRDANCGYNLLKSKLQAKRANEQAAGGSAPADGAAGGMASDNDDPGQRHQERNKRRRSGSPRREGGGYDGDRIGSSDLFHFMRTAYDDVKSKGEIELELRVVSLRSHNETLQARYDALVIDSTANYATKDKALSEEKRLVSELSLRYDKANDMIIDISSNLSVRERELGELRASQVIFCIG